MTKILHVITRLDMGGSAQNTLLGCKKLSGKYETFLVHGLSHESRMTDLEKRIIENGVEEAKAQGVKVIALPSMVRSIRPVKDFKALISLVCLIFKEKPDIVHTHSSKGGILRRLAAKIAGLSHIIHTPHGHLVYGHFGPIASKIFLWVEKIFSRFTDRMVALTDGEKDDYLNLSVFRHAGSAVAYRGYGPRAGLSHGGRQTVSAQRVGNSRIMKNMAQGKSQTESLLTKIPSISYI